MKKEYIYIIFLSLAIVIVLWGIVGLLNKAYTVKEDSNDSSFTKIENIYQNATTVPTMMEEKKVSPNSSFALKKYYDECNHFEYEEAQLPIELVNLTRQEVEDYYDGWEVEEFETNKLVLSKEIDGYCNQHFCIKLDDDKINIYRLLNNGNLAKYKETDISREYLPEEDIGKLEEGIYVFGEGKLSSVLEDFE